MALAGHHSYSATRACSGPTIFRRARYYGLSRIGRAEPPRRSDLYVASLAARCAATKKNYRRLSTVADCCARPCNNLKEPAACGRSPAAGRIRRHRRRRDLQRGFGHHQGPLSTRPDGFIHAAASPPIIAVCRGLPSTMKRHRLDQRLRCPVRWKARACW